MLILSIPNAQVPSLVALDNTAFRDAYLTITAPRYVNIDPEATAKKTLADAELSKNTQDTIAMLEQVLINRYDPNSKMLDLSRLGDDPILKGAGIFDMSSTTSKFFPALMLVADKKFKTAQEKKEAVVSVTLAHNNLTSVQTVSTFAITFPDIENLSLEGNNLKTWESIHPFKFKFRELKQLILMGNPITEEKNYKQEIIRRYVKLQMLDNEVIDRAQIGLPAPPPPPPPQPKAAGIVEARHGESGSALPIKGNFLLDDGDHGTTFLQQ